MSFLNLLKIPETQSIKDLDCVDATLLHRRILSRKLFLKKLYADFYASFRPLIDPCHNGKFLELGSGGGIAKEIFPDIITSDVLQIQGLDLHCSGLALPFKNEILDGIFMLDTLHHIPHAELFFREAQRCLKKGAHIAMIEPANTAFARFIYQNFHHEHFDPSAPEWNFPSHGPLSSANGALPWIIFQRDRNKFQNTFPQLKILAYRNHTPLRYLVSGGFTLKQLLPSFLYPLIKGIEWALSPLHSQAGLFTTIILQKAS